MLYDFLLNGLYDVGEEMFRFFDEIVVLYFGSDKVDEVGWEENFFIRWWGCSVRRGDF